MKKLLSIIIFALPSIFAVAQESESSAPDSESATEESGTNSTHRKPHQYFIATNSGLNSTPVGFRIGILDHIGGYIGMRFGKGYKYKEDQFSGLTVSKATLFAVNAGVLLPIATEKAFKVRTFVGLGYGKWFNRPSQNGQTMGLDLEAGLMFQYQRLLLTTGANLLTGDGKPPKKDFTLGIGLKF